MLTYDTLSRWKMQEFFLIFCTLRGFVLIGAADLWKLRGRKGGANGQMMGVMVLHQKYSLIVSILSYSVTDSVGLLESGEE